MVELVYKFDEKSYCECLKGESISKVCFKYFFVHKHNNIIILYVDTTTDNFTPLALRVRVNNDSYRWNCVTPSYG